MLHAIISIDQSELSLNKDTDLIVYKRIWKSSDYDTCQYMCVLGIYTVHAL